MQEIINQSETYLMNNYGRFPVVVDRGEGAYLWDVEGNKYLDMFAGIGVSSLGHGHKGLTESLEKQVKKLLHISNLYYHEPQLEASKLLIEGTAFVKAFFCNSGTEANEAAIKLARKYGKSQSEDKTVILSLEHSFHGRTYGALSATAQYKYQKDFMPIVPDFGYLPPNDMEALQNSMNDKVCAVMVEVIQGEGGVNVIQKGYLQQIAQLCKQYDALLIVDEVQTGIGRTGTFFAYEQFGIEPDVVTLAKGLGGGVPVGAIVCNQKANRLQPGDHGTTFGGNPLATAAVGAVLKAIKEEAILPHVQEVGSYLKEAIEELGKECPVIKEVRGLGLMMGIELEISAKEVVEQCIKEGVLLITAGEKVLRLLPPLIVGKEQVDECVGVLKKVLGNNRK